MFSQNKLKTAFEVLEKTGVIFFFTIIKTFINVHYKDTKYNFWKKMKNCIFNQDKSKIEQLVAPTKVRLTFTFKLN